VVPPIVASGVGPLMVEYIDMVTMAGITANAGIDLGIPETSAGAALWPIWSSSSRTITPSGSRRTPRRWPSCSSSSGALDVYVLPDQAGAQLIRAREGRSGRRRPTGPTTSWTSWCPGPRSPASWPRRPSLADTHATLVTGCGHVGDGNVHLSVWQSDPESGPRSCAPSLRVGMELGGAISGEHGIGTAKKRPFQAELEDPDQDRSHATHQRCLRPARHSQPGTTLRPMTVVDP
jgi:glycolate oxidase